MQDTEETDIHHQHPSFATPPRTLSPATSQLRVITQQQSFTRTDSNIHPHLSPRVSVPKFLTPKSTQSSFSFLPFIHSGGPHVQDNHGSLYEPAAPVSCCIDETIDWPPFLMSPRTISRQPTESHMPQPSPTTSPTFEPPGPHNIEAVISLGDSLLSGLCLPPPHCKCSPIQRPIFPIFKHTPLWLKWFLTGENRHLTFTNGSDPHCVSLAKCIQTFNPSVRGMCKQRTNVKSKGSEFNFSVSGSVMEDVMEQCKRLLAKLKQDPIDGWKLVVLWCGSNDVLYPRHSLSSLQKHLLQILTLLTTNLENVIIVVMTVPELPKHLQRKGFKRRRNDVNTLLRVMTEQVLWESLPPNVIIKLCHWPSYTSSQQKDVLLNYVSHIDSVHPNLRAHALFAKAVWNLLGKGETYKTGEEWVNAKWWDPSESEGNFWFCNVRRGTDTEKSKPPMAYVPGD